MKKVFTILSALLLMAGVSFAQTGQNHNEIPEVKAKTVTANMSHIVGLDGDQQGKVFAIYTDYFKAFNESEALKATDAAAAAAKLKAATEARDKALKALLTADQLKTWNNDKNSKL